MKSWVIINLRELSEPDHFPDISPDSCRIPADKRPTVLYDGKEAAERELARLARNHVGDFFLFESIAVGTAIQTCAGKVGRVDLLPEDQRAAMEKALTRKPRRQPATLKFLKHE